MPRRAGRSSTSCASTPATAIASPDEVDRNAANAPAVTTPGQQVAASAAEHQPGQLEHDGVGVRDQVAA